MQQIKLKGRMMFNAKKVLLIGGHPRWQKFFKKDNPEVTVISPKSKIIPKGILNKVDKVLINSNHLPHNQFISYMNLIKLKNIPIQYVK